MQTQTQADVAAMCPHCGGTGWLDMGEGIGVVACGEDCHRVPDEVEECEDGQLAIGVPGEQVSFLPRPMFAEPAS